MWMSGNVAVLRWNLTTASHTYHNIRSGQRKPITSEVTNPMTYHLSTCFSILIKAATQIDFLYLQMLPSQCSPLALLPEPNLAILGAFSRQCPSGCIAVILLNWWISGQYQLMLICLNIKLKLISVSWPSQLVMFVYHLITSNDVSFHFTLTDWDPCHGPTPFEWPPSGQWHFEWTTHDVQG